MSWTFEPPSGGVATTFTILNAVNNGGTAPSGPFTVGFYLSADTAFTTSDTLIGSRSYTDLAAGAAGQDENTPVAVPDSVPAGAYYLGTIVDTANEVAESNETNNVFFDPDPITMADAPAPDIGASNFLVGGTGLFKRYNFLGEARNLGTAPTGPFAVAYYISVDPTFTLGDTLLGVANVTASRPRRHRGPAPVLRRPGVGPGGVVPPGRDPGPDERRRRVERDEQRRV